MTSNPKTSESFGIHIEIRELENGFVVHFFSTRGNAKFDKDTYFPAIVDVANAILFWFKELNGEESIDKNF